MPPWATLPRATDDNQTINEAIDEAIGSHNADPEAHLAEDEAVEVHRTAPVVDHPAESVVNDKIQVSARRYVAVVDPNDENAFDTLESAIDYADTVGGGDIFLVAGTHYLSDTLIQIKTNIGIFGLGMGETILETIDSDLIQIAIIGSEPPSGIEPSFVMQDVSLSPTNRKINLNHEVANSTMKLDRVEFYQCASGTYSALYAGEDQFERHEITDCRFHCYDDLECASVAWGLFYNCSFIARENGWKGLYTQSDCLVLGCRFLANTPLGAYDNGDWWKTFAGDQIFDNNYITYNRNTPMATNSFIKFTNNIVTQSSGDNFDVTTDNNIITGNKIDMLGSGSIRLVSGADNNIACNNQVDVAWTNSGTGNQVANNVTF